MNALGHTSTAMKKHALMGEIGAGQLTKMVNQICIAGVLQGLSEGVHFAQQAGLDVDAVIDVISQGAAQSWQMNNRANTMARDEYEFGFAVDWMRKDLGIALGTAKQVGARLPLTALVDQFYADVQNMDGGRWDTSSLLRRLSSSKSVDRGPDSRWSGLARDDSASPLVSGQLRRRSHAWDCRCRAVEDDRFCSCRRSFHTSVRSSRVCGQLRRSP